MHRVLYRTFFSERETIIWLDAFYFSFTFCNHGFFHVNCWCLNSSGVFSVFHFILMKRLHGECRFHESESVSVRRSHGTQECCGVSKSYGPQSPRGSPPLDNLLQAPLMNRLVVQ